MDIKITFPGGKKVDADIGGMLIRTDQPVKYGGDGTAPSPFEHFLASIGTCAGIFVPGFYQGRRAMCREKDHHGAAGVRGNNVSEQLNCLPEPYSPCGLVV